jgi:coenzyme F420-dependent glucose-6-phosphate dehydrogenase
MSGRAVKFGYKASAEQFGPAELLEFSVLAEQAGLESVAISDHFQPWRHSTGHAPNSLVWLGALGQATEKVMLATSVLTPTMRYHPSIVAQSFATLACLNPGRVVLGIGTGEAMNETPATAAEWPGAKERRMRMAESITLMRQLWTEERVTFTGEYYSTERATIYDRPEQPVPIYVAASGPLAAKLVGRVADGFICTSGKAPELYETLLANVAEGAESRDRDPAGIERMIEIKVSYDRDLEAARTNCHWWAALALSGDEKSGIEDPIEMERLADANLDRAHTRFIVSDDPEAVVEQIRPYVELGFDHLVFHGPGDDQRRFLEQFSVDVLPLLRERFGAAAVASGGAA